LEPNQDAARAVNDGAQLGRTLGFMRVLLGLGHALEARSKRMQSSIGLTASQRLVLRIVGRYPGISAGELAQIMEVHASTLTGVLQRLTERRLLLRREDASDRRRALLELTEEGAKIDELRTGTVEAAVRRSIGRCDDEKIAAAIEVLNSVCRELTRDD